MSDEYTPSAMNDRFDILYCDNTRGCRVNTFERGEDGLCPACGEPGKEMRHE